MCGSAKLNSKLQVAELPVSIYVSRLSKATTAKNIKEHIVDMGEVCLDVQLLAQKNETSFNSFKVIIPKNKINVFLANNFWPEGIKYRLFRERFIDVSAKGVDNETTNIL